MDPSAPVYTPPPAPSTSIPKVFGVLSIIFGSLVLLGGLLGSCGSVAGCAAGNLGTVMSRNDAQSAQAMEMLSLLKTVYAGFAAQSLMLTAMSGWLIALGIGQLKYRKWARGQSVIWGGTALVVLLAFVLISFLVIGPGYAKFFDFMSKQSHGEMPDLGGGMASMFGGSFAIMSLFFYSPYPILMLAMFTRPKVKEAMVN